MEEVKKVEQPPMSENVKVGIVVGFIIGLGAIIGGLIALSFYGHPVKEYISGSFAFITANAWPMIATGIIIYYRSDIHQLFKRITKAKFLGFDAEWRELKAEAEEAIQKNYAAIEELRELSIALSTPILDMLAIAGEPQNRMPLNFKLDRLGKIRDALKNLNVDPALIEMAGAVLTVVGHMRHVHLLIDALLDANPDDAELQELRTRGGLAFEMKLREVESVQAYIKERNLKVDAEVMEAILDLDHYLKTYKLRRPHMFPVPD